MGGTECLRISRGKPGVYWKPGVYFGNRASIKDGSEGIGEGLETAEGPRPTRCIYEQVTPAPL